MTDIKVLCDQIRRIAFAIHVYHGHGHLEKVYENALVHRLRKAGLNVLQQHPIQVFDEDGTLIGEHVAQILGYLKSARIEHGLLINFGSYKFEIRKYAWSEPTKKHITSEKEENAEIKGLSS
jgi:hypothetical protein